MALGNAVRCDAVLMQADVQAQVLMLVLMLVLVLVLVLVSLPPFPYLHPSLPCLHLLTCVRVPFSVFVQPFAGQASTQGRCNQELRRKSARSCSNGSDRFGRFWQ
jgi:hypothetical protein